MHLLPKCPICRSTRTRKGYRPTPVWSKLILRFNLLCDNCNWEFAGFALPWKIPVRSTKGQKRYKINVNEGEEKKMTVDLQRL